MQMQAQAQAGQLPPGAPAGLPPGLLGAPGHPAAGGLPTSLSLLAGIPTSLAQAVAGSGAAANLPHPAFANLLAKQPAGAAEAALLAAKAREEAENNAKKAETNGSGKQR